MPSTYAHYRFGQEVLLKVSPPVREVIEQYPDLYNIGLHGPDLLFYYNALSKNHVNTCGYDLHKYPGRFFFERAAGVIREKKMDSAYLSHIYGYLCHFSLDVTCHGFVEDQISETGVSHLAIECELDRRLLEIDGKDPLSSKVTGHLIPSDKTAEVIQSFYPGISSEEVYKSIRDMVFYLDLLVCSSDLKRKFLTGIIKLVGKYDSIGGLVMRKKEIPEGIPSVDHLLELYEEAMEPAISLIESFRPYLDEKAELDEIFNYNFDSRLESGEKQ